VAPVRFAIGDVVHEVDDARERAEDDEGLNRKADGTGVEERADEPAIDAALAEDQRREDKQVLRPL
jgi:hypothetical protein